MPQSVAVGVIMGSQSDWDTMRHTVETLKKLGIGHEARIISAHRTPARLNDYVETARDRGLKVIIAGAGGAAALPGAVTALTPLPVLGVPMLGWALSGWDAMLAMVQMPSGYPVGTLAIGKPGAINAALLAASIVALSDPDAAAALDRYRAEQTAKVPEVPTD
jgi:5-(carboxyamino)imidazole ribonucleotide mutase